jgi:hypothetical protein
MLVRPYRQKMLVACRLPVSTPPVMRSRVPAELPSWPRMLLPGPPQTAKGPSGQQHRPGWQHWRASRCHQDCCAHACAEACPAEATTTEQVRAGQCKNWQLACTWHAASSMSAASAPSAVLSHPGTYCRCMNKKSASQPTATPEQCSVSPFPLLPRLLLLPPHRHSSALLH